MIEWLASSDLRRRLRDHPPIGLWLREWFWAIASTDPDTTLPFPAEHHVEEGLGPLKLWTGMVDDVPFALRSMANPFSDNFGFALLLPVRRHADHVHIDALAQLHPHLPPWRGPYFDQLPMRAGYGIVPAGSDDPIYSSRSHDEASAVVALLGPQYRIVELSPEATGWIVVGPAVGPYVSRLEVVASESAARELAARWARETGATFEILTQL